MGEFVDVSRPTKQLPGGEECFIKHLGECGEPWLETSGEDRFEMVFSQGSLGWSGEPWLSTSCKWLEPFGGLWARWAGMSLKLSRIKARYSCGSNDLKLGSSPHANMIKYVSTESFHSGDKKCSFMDPTLDLRLLAEDQKCGNYRLGKFAAVRPDFLKFCVEARICSDA